MDTAMAAAVSPACGWLASGVRSRDGGDEDAEDMCVSGAIGGGMAMCRAMTRAVVMP